MAVRRAGAARLAWRMLAAALLAGAGGAAWAAADDAAAARSDWILYCAGCHGMDAAGLPPRVPQMRDRVGWFLQLPEGRAYLVQVPGMNNSGLDDRRMARLVNWLVPQFGGGSRPATFVPYSADEVARLRADHPRDIVMFRRALGRELAARGTPVD